MSIDEFYENVKKASEIFHCQEMIKNAKITFQNEVCMAIKLHGESMVIGMPIERCDLSSLATALNKEYIPFVITQNDSSEAPTGTLVELSKEIHDNAVEHGWWDEERSFGEIIALCHSELSEALEEYRSGHPTMWQLCRASDGYPCLRDGCGDWSNGICELNSLEQKPEGIAVEMADCIIRILDWCGKENIDIDNIIKRKMEYNKTRTYRHGGKVL